MEWAYMVTENGASATSPCGQSVLIPLASDLFALFIGYGPVTRDADVMLSYSDYSIRTVEDIARLRRRMSDIPPKRVDHNLLVCSWNVRVLGGLHPLWTENDGSPKRNLRGLAIIAEVIRRFDVIAVQEVKRETTALRRLMDDFLGPAWDVILSDVTAGDKGNTERLAFIYDTRRVRLSGLAGEIVLPPVKVKVEDDGETTVELHPTEQFARTPYVVGFEAAGERFSLLTAHIEYGEGADDRIDEIEALAAYTATEIRDRAAANDAEFGNLIVLGDFNIDRRINDPLFKAFTSTGLNVPSSLRDLKTTYGTEPKFYDQIAWFMGAMDLRFSGRAGVIDFVDAVFQRLSTRSMTYRISDHFPLWVEFIVDRSEEEMAGKLGVGDARSAVCRAGLAEQAMCLVFKPSQNAVLGRRCR